MTRQLSDEEVLLHASLTFSLQRQPTMDRAEILAFYRRCEDAAWIKSQQPEDQHVGSGADRARGA